MACLVAGLILFAATGSAEAEEAVDFDRSGAPSFDPGSEDGSKAGSAQKPAKKPKAKAGVTVRTGEVPHPPPKPPDLVAADEPAAEVNSDVEPAASETAALEPNARPLPPAPPKPGGEAEPPAASESESAPASDAEALPATTGAEEPESSGDATEPSPVAVADAERPVPKPAPPKPAVTDEVPLATAETPLPPPTPELPSSAEEPTSEQVIASLPEEPVSVANDALRIPFGEGGADIPGSALQPLQELAARMSREPTLRVQLFAFATGTQETASQARRLSLSRALAVRAVLIDAGVRSTRMDVRALGANTNEAPTDRVDVLVVRRGGG